MKHKTKTRAKLNYIFEDLEPRLLLSADLSLGIDPARERGTPESSSTSQNTLGNTLIVAATLTETLSGTEQISATPAAATTHDPRLPPALDGPGLRDLYGLPPLLSGARAEASAAPLQENTDATGAGRHEIVFVDSGIANYQALLADLAAQNNGERRLEVYLLDGAQNGIAKISAVLGTQHDIDAVHIISHGNQHGLQLGGSWLDLNGLQAASDDISAWRRAFNNGADLLFYGCDLAASGEGLALVNTLGKLTGADVAASSDLTGHTLLGGDWTLEYHTGQIDARAAVSEQLQANWQITLTVKTFQNGVGGYTNTFDTELNNGAPTSNNSNIIVIELDSNPTRQGLIRFDNLFGVDAGQIPYGSTINSATLTLTVSGPSVAGATIQLHDMKTSWADNSTWNTLVNGVQLNGVEAGVLPISILASPDLSGAQSFTGLQASLQAWSNGGVNQGWVIVNDNDQPWKYYSEDVSTVALRPILTLDYTAPTIMSGALLLSTDNHVSGGGQTGADTWRKADVVQMNDPNLAFAPTVTSGSFSVPVNLSQFIADKNINALHYVSSDMPLGASNFQLKAGDLLLASSDGTLLTSTATPTDAGFNNSLTVGKEDIFIFRPVTPGDYSNGTFAILLKGLAPAGKDVFGVSLIERSVTVGDATLNKGDFLFTRGGADDDNDVWLFRPTDVGATTSGSTQLFLQGDDPGVGISKKIYGIDVVEKTTTVGGRLLPVGTLLLSVDAATKVGSNLLTVTEQDIFAFAVSQTSLVSGLGNGVASASLFFSGADVAFAAGAEKLDAISLTVSNANDAPLLNPVSPNLTILSEDNITNAGNTVSSLLGGAVSDADGDTPGIALAATANGNGTWQYSLDGGLAWTAVGAVSDNNALLLRHTDLVRFVPDQLNADSAALTYRAWDQSGGSSAGSKVNTSINGGITPYSNTTDTATLTVTAVNDAPALTNTALTAVLEDDGNPAGETVATLFGGLFADVDSGASLTGVAVVGNAAPTTQGMWQYSSDGVTWRAIGGVADNATALALSAATKLRFVPAADFNGTPTALAVRALDNSYGGAYSTTAGTESRITVDTSSNGGTSAVSASKASIVTTVTAVNDAPSGTDNTVVEPQDNVHVFSVADFGYSDSNDSPANAMQAVRIDAISKPLGATLTNGVTPVNAGDSIAVADILAGNLVFTPASGAIGLNYARIGFMVIDDGGGANIDLTPNTLTIDMVAPRYLFDQFTGVAYNGSNGNVDWSTRPWQESGEANGPLFGAVRIDSTGIFTTNNLQITANLLNAAATRAASLAGATTATLSFEYARDSWGGFGNGVVALVISNDGGATWNPTPLQTFNLSATDPVAQSASFDISTSISNNTQIRFVVTNASAIGGKLYIDNLKISYELNNAPTALVAPSPTLTSIGENALNNSGDEVASFVNLSHSDADGHALGIAVTATGNGNGGWQYSTNGGASWSAVGAVADNNALLLRATDRVRLVPDGNNADSASLSYRAWDQTNGAAAGDKVDTTGNGGTTAYSTATATATITVTAVNDAPSLGDAVLPAVLEDASNPAGATLTALFGSGYTDVDSGASLSGLAVTGNTSPASAGMWQYSSNGGANWFTIGAVTDSGNALALSATTLVRFVPAADFNGAPAALALRGLDDSYTGGFSSTGGTESRVTLDTRANGGTTAIAGVVSQITTTVTALNDAPSVGSATLPAVFEDAPNPVGNTLANLFGGVYTDIDTGSLFSGMVVISNTAPATQGAWQYSSDGGANWYAVGGADDNSNALALSKNTLVRFLPATDFNGSPTGLVLRGLDDSYTGGYSSTAGMESRVTITTSSNGGTTAIAAAASTLTTSITAINDAPSGADKTITTAEDAPYTFSTADFGFSDSIEGHALFAVKITTVPSAGTLSNNGSAVAAGNVISAAGIGSGNFKFTPAPNANGSNYASFTFQVQDDGGVLNGGADLDPTANTITLDVTPVNDAPSGTDKTIITGEDAPYTFTLADFGYSDTVEGHALFAVKIITLPGAGVLTSSGAAITAGDFISAVDIAAAQLVFTPAPNANGSNYASFTFQVQDDGGVLNGGADLDPIANTLTLDVTPVNDAPTLGDATLVAIRQGITDPAGETVFNLFSTTLSDDDAGARLTGIAIVNNPAYALNQGQWQYSTNGGNNWFSIGSVNDGAALALDGATLIRFVPATGFSGAPAALTLRAIDDSYDGVFSSTQGVEIREVIDTSNRGGTASVSAGTATLSASISFVPYLNAPAMLNSVSNPALVESDQAYSDSNDDEDSAEIIFQYSLKKSAVSPVDGIANTISFNADSIGVDSAESTVNESQTVYRATNSDSGSAALKSEKNILETLAGFISALADPQMLLSKSGADTAETQTLRDLFERTRFMQDLDQVREEVTSVNMAVVGSTVVITTGLSVGYVLWIARGGILLASLLSTMPAWRLIDPLPVLASLRKSSGTEEDDSLQSIIQKRANADKANTPVREWVLMDSLDHSTGRSARNTLSENGFTSSAQDLAASPSSVHEQPAP